MRIGYNCRFLYSDHITGVERYAANILDRFLKMGQEEFTLFGSQARKDLVPSGHEPRHVGSCPTGSAAGRHAWEQFILPQLAKREKVDLLFNPINTAPLLFSKNMLVLHDLSFLDHPEWFSASFSRLYGALVPRAAKKALAVITDSFYSKARIENLLGIRQDVVHAVHLGVDPVFRRDADEIERVRKKLGLEKPYILCTGSIAPRKNLQTAIEAFDMVKTALPEPHELVIAGASGPQFASAGVTGIPEIRFTGYVEDKDLPGLYAGASLFLYPSLYEGFGLPPLEAMACGTPVITSNATSLPEVVGNAGITLDPKDTRGFADAIIAVLTDSKLSTELSEKGINRARRFTWEETARKTLELCRQTAICTR